MCVTKVFTDQRIYQEIKSLMRFLAETLVIAKVPMLLVKWRPSHESDGSLSRVFASAKD